MKTYKYHTEQILKTDLDHAWEFFSSPKNLSKITPPEMDFKILTQLNGEEIYDGMLIDYTVKPLFGLKMHWQTKICQVNKPAVFADTQLKGPYKLWEHVHTFEKVEQGVLMKDTIHYALPLGFLGDIMHGLVVKKKIENIFNFRRITLEKLFNNN